MSELPEGWSIEAYGTDVVVRVPRTTHTEHMLNHVEARILGRYLYAAALTADRARLRAIEDTASAFLIAAAVVIAAIGSASPAYSKPGGGCYTAESDDCVPYPQQGGSQPQGATVQCADGSWSFSEHRHASGTCHGHGGVQQYL